MAHEILRAHAPCRFEYLREVSGLLTGVCHSGDQWTAWQTSPDRANWTEIDPNSVASAFRIGHKVSFDASSLTWSSAGQQYAWNDGPALQVDPTGYPLFANRSGSGDALAFEVITALSFDPATNFLEIGTEGGLFRWPFQPGKTITLHGGEGGMQFLFNSERPKDLVTGIARLRRDANGALWAQLTWPHRLAILQSGTRWKFFQGDTWPLDKFERQGWAASLDGDGFLSSRTKWLESTDAFGIGSGPIEEVLDFEYDTRNGALWILTRKQGLYKVFTPYIERVQPAEP